LVALCSCDGGREEHDSEAMTSGRPCAGGLAPAGAHPLQEDSMTSTHDSNGGRPAADNGFAGDPEVQAEIARRLEVVTAPDYKDPARKDFTAVDWLALGGFLAACAAGFTVWGY
jgi:hypothetical protein